MVRDTTTVRLFCPRPAPPSPRWRWLSVCPVKRGHAGNSVRNEGGMLADDQAETAVVSGVGDKKAPSAAAHQG